MSFCVHRHGKSSFCFHLDYYLEAGQNGTQRSEESEKLIKKVCGDVMGKAEEDEEEVGGGLRRGCEAWLERHGVE